MCGKKLKLYLATFLNKAIDSRQRFVRLIRGRCKGFIARVSAYFSSESILNNADLHITLNELKVEQEQPALNELKVEQEQPALNELKVEQEQPALNESHIEIDNLTSLPYVDASELIKSRQPSQTIVVPEIYVNAKKHELSKPSSNVEEQKKYEEHEFRAPEMRLEYLQDQYWFPESGFLVSKQGKVWRHSVLGQYADPHFITTYAVQEREGIDGEGEWIFHEHLLHTAPIIDELCLITSHYASHNYGHFMLDMVPLIQQGVSLGIQLISRPLLKWHEAIYKRVGVDVSRVSICNERVVFLKNVIVSNRHNAEGTYAASPNHRIVFESIFKNIPQLTSVKSQGRIFLSRGEVRSRKIKNRASLEAMLRSQGFVVIRPETLTFDEQALIFAQAEIIVSEFGAGMANVVFCKPGTKVIEIIPEDQNDPWSRHLCASMALEHITLFHPVKEEDRESFDIAGRIHKNIYFSFDADVRLIKNVITT